MHTNQQHLLKDKVGHSILLLLLSGLIGGAHAAPIIDLSKPVSESVSSFTGIYYKFDSTYIDGSDTRTPDSSGAGYNGTLLSATGGSPPVLKTGVNISGASGYGNALEFTPGSPNGNSKIYYDGPNNGTYIYNYSMVDTDFTGGAWLNFNSILSTGTAQQVIIFDRGGWLYDTGSSNGGHYSFYLEKTQADAWSLRLEIGDGITYQTASVAIPAIELDEWNHFGLTYDYGGGSGNNTVTFWRNGQELGSGNFSINITAGSSDYTVRRFAVSERAVSLFTSTFDGRMDDLFVTEGLYDFQAVPETSTAALLIFLGIAALVMRQRKAF